MLTAAGNIDSWSTRRIRYRQGGSLRLIYGNSVIWSHWSVWQLLGSSKSCALEMGGFGTTRPCINILTSLTIALFLNLWCKMITFSAVRKTKRAWLELMIATYDVYDAHVNIMQWKFAILTKLSHWCSTIAETSPGANNYWLWHASAHCTCL